MGRWGGKIATSWKRFAACALVALSCAWLAVPAEAGGPRRNLSSGIIVDVPHVDAVLYEVTEKMYLLDANGNVVGPDMAMVRKADASLYGWARLGSPLCPSPLLVTKPKSKTCSVTADGVDNISLWTGLGDVTGTFAVVVQDDNAADAPEYVVMNGGFSGNMDLSIRPLGKVVGSFTSTAAGEAVNFCGTFRLPFSLTSDGIRVDPRRGASAYYLADDGSSLIEVKRGEMSLGMPTVRLEVNFGNNCK